MTMKAWNAAILGTAIIWAGVIIAVALLLAGTGYFGQLIPSLGGGAAGNLIVVAGATGRTRPAEGCDGQCPELEKPLGFEQEREHR